jgi:hypothetical protein
MNEVSQLVSSENIYFRPTNYEIYLQIQSQVEKIN